MKHVLIVALLLSIGVLAGCNSDEVSSTGAQKTDVTCTINGQPCPTSGLK